MTPCLKSIKKPSFDFGRRFQATTQQAAFWKLYSRYLAKDMFWQTAPGLETPHQNQQYVAHLDCYHNTSELSEVLFQHSWWVMSRTNTSQTLSISLDLILASCLIVNGHALLLASRTTHCIPAIVHNLTADLTRNAAPAHVESYFLSDVHHDSSCFYRSVLNSAGSACGRYRVRSMKSNPCVCAARSVNVAPFGEAGPVWRGSSLNLAGVLHSELVIGRDSESDWLYLKLLLRATHFKSRIQRYQKCYNIANYSSMFEQMHLHIHKINALQDSFNTWNQSSVFKARREPPVWDNRDVLHNEYRAQITWALICRDVWCIEEGGNHWTSQDAAKLSTACRLVNPSETDLMLRKYRERKEKREREREREKRERERERETEFYGTFSQFLVQFISVLSFHRAWEHSIALHRRPSFDIDEHPWLRASLTWCLVLLSSGIGSFNMLSWEDRKSLT